MAKDWMTGNDFGPQESSPWGALAAGLMQAQQQKRVQAQMEQEQKRQAALEELQANRGMIEQLATKDPSIMGTPWFKQAYVSGDLDIVGQNYKPAPVQQKPITLAQGAQLYDPSGQMIAENPKAPGQQSVKTATFGGQVHQLDPQTGQWIPLGSSEGALSRSQPEAPKEKKYLRSFRTTPDNQKVMDIIDPDTFEKIKTIPLGDVRKSGFDMGALLGNLEGEDPIPGAAEASPNGTADEDQAFLDQLAILLKD